MSNIAIMGYGTVGSGVAEALSVNGGLISRAAGREAGLKYVLDVRDFPGDRYNFIKDFNIIVNDPGIDVVVEAIGGASHALGMDMLIIYAAARTLRTCNYIINDTFRASGETVFGTVIELSCLFFITLPSVWLAGIFFHAPYIAVFSLVFIDDLVRIPAVIWYLRSGRWVKPVTEEGRLALADFKQSLARRTQIKV